jgi:SpoVK/Ycf46/Vps4 family AAA+-type ATPase
VEAFHNGREHLLAELKALELMLARQVWRLRAAMLMTEDQFRGLYISDEQVDRLLSPQINGEALENLQKLSARLEEVRAENRWRAEAAREQGITLPLVRLADLFALDRFETDLLLLGLAPELDLKYQTLYAYVQNDVARKYPTVDMALKMLCQSFEELLERRAHFAPEGSLFRHQLMRLAEDSQEREPPLVARVLKLDSRITDFILGREGIDEKLSPFTRRSEPRRSLSDLAFSCELLQQLTRVKEIISDGSGGGMMFHFHGRYGTGKQTAAEAICAELGQPLLVVELDRALPIEVGSLGALLRREARLQSAGLYFKHLDVLLNDDRKESPAAALVQEFCSLEQPVFFASETGVQASGILRDGHVLRVEFQMPGASLRRSLWEQALIKETGSEAAACLEVAELAERYVLSAGQIGNAARDARLRSALRPNGQGKIADRDLYEAARGQSGQGLRQSAKKVEPFFDWPDLVLPPRTMRQLKEACAFVRFRHQVYTRWGFETKLSLGKGMNVLFSGPSGTGKTMAASIIARELNLDLYKIDLSLVVSKYIGETEKNLSRIFGEAHVSNAILFFDEADALFGKRSEVKDAHDRYANIEVAYLLQKVEEYEGVIILATNFDKNLDEAFVRRVHHTIEFPFPEAKYRERIWRGMIPPDAPLAEEIDFNFLASQFELAGGNIRNVVMAAAFMAAEHDSKLRMNHFIQATSREVQKMGRLPSKADFREYYELIREQS